VTAVGRIAAPSASPNTVFRFSGRRRRVTIAMLALAALGACRGPVDHLSYDSDGVAKDVLALVAHNTIWARTLEPDAVLYRIELRSDKPGDSAPTYALYSFYAPRANAFMTASSDPKTPWDGAEPQYWPLDALPPLPLPAVPMDFREAWVRARDAGLTNVSSAVLEVQRRFGFPIVVWTLTGQLPGTTDGAVYFNAITKDRIQVSTLVSPPASPLVAEQALFEYRRALRGRGGRPDACSGPAIAIPAVAPVICFEVGSRTYSPPVDE
jgi:hypothetical protein